MELAPRAERSDGTSEQRIATPGPIRLVACIR